LVPWAKAVRKIQSSLNGHWLSSLPAGRRASKAGQVWLYLRKNRGLSFIPAGEPLAPMAEAEEHTIFI
jgi:hypothetical protein